MSPPIPTPEWALAAATEIELGYCTTEDAAAMIARHWRGVYPFTPFALVAQQAETIKRLEARAERAEGILAKAARAGSPELTFADLNAYLLEQEATIASLRAQLPEDMEDCTIRFKSCPLGHGWLTATNWVQHGCPTCERDRLRAALQEVADADPSWRGHVDAILHPLRPRGEAGSAL